MLKISICDISLKIIHLRLQQCFPGANHRQWVNLLQAEFDLLMQKVSTSIQIHSICERCKWNSFLTSSDGFESETENKTFFCVTQTAM